MASANQVSCARPVVHLRTWAGQIVHLFGVPDYNSACGGEEVYKLLLEELPGVVLMESFDACDEEVNPGDVIPYRSILSGPGLERALANITHSQFRQTLTAEVVAV